MWTARAMEAGKQKLSSPSVGSALDPRSSLLPAGHAIGTPLLSSPYWLAGIALGPSQNEKCPISLENPMLYVWAAQITRVCSDEVLYIGWKSYGIAVQLVPGFGSYWI